MAKSTRKSSNVLPINKRLRSLRPRGHYQITLGDVLEAHEAALRFGGAPGILDLGRVEAAIGRPYAGYYRTLPAKAAALLQSLVRNHGFVDANKRTALLCVYLFITRSGWRFHQNRTIPDHFERLIIRVANNDLPLRMIRVWFERRLRPIEPLMTAASKSTPMRRRVSGVALTE